MKQNNKLCKCRPGAGCVICCPIEETTTKEFAKKVRQRLLDELEDCIIECKHAYYCIGKPLVNDATYDAYEDALRSQRPDSYIFNIVGCYKCYNSNKEE